MKNKKNKYFFIVVTDSRKSRDGKYVDKIGYYNAIKGIFDINNDKLFYWNKIGAKCNLTVRNLIKFKNNEYIKRNT